MSDPKERVVSAREFTVLLRRLEALEASIRARDWGSTEFSYDQVLSAAHRMAGTRERQTDIRRQLERGAQ
jgi:hypothetical protein